MSKKNKKNQPVKKLGRPTKVEQQEEVLNETSQDRLNMSNKNGGKKDYTIEEVTRAWSRLFGKMASVDGKKGAKNVAEKWSDLNPFLQNQRLKNLYTQSKKYSKIDIGSFLEAPGNHESELRGLGWANSASQQIYYNILRRSTDIPQYHYFVIPELLDNDGGYNKEDFNQEDKLVNNWLETFNVANTFKTIALEVKREGKASYLLRNKIVGQGKNRQTAFCTLQKMPTDWIKITGKGQLGYTISFDMMYFLDIANNPSNFGEFMVAAWNDIIETGVVDLDKVTNKYKLNIGKAARYSFSYKGDTYASSIEFLKRGDQDNYMFWLRLPYDMCYTFGSDNSHPWMAPDTMGLMLKLQELTDYGQLAGLIASTPLTAVLTGEIESIPNARAGKNESIFTPEVLRGYMDQFNDATSTNIEAWLFPAKNVKLQQLSTDVNSSEIISTATSNFLESAGEGGLTIATDKPNVAQITVAKQLAASQQRYVTLQFEQVLNFILQHKLGFKYTWKVRIWGDVFNNDSDKKYLKEIVANGNVALLPKLMSAEGMSMRDTKAVSNYIKSLGFYEDFMTYTQLKNAELATQQQEQEAEEEEETSGVGRPSLSDDEVENDATAKSKERGDNISDNREQ